MRQALGFRDPWGGTLVWRFGGCEVGRPGKEEGGEEAYSTGGRVCLVDACDGFGRRGAVQLLTSSGIMGAEPRKRGGAFSQNTSG